MAEEGTVVAARAGEKLAALRQLLAERYPEAARASHRCLETGVRSMDTVAGGIPLGAVTEIVGATMSSGCTLLLGQLLLATRVARWRVALVDASNQFDPASYADDTLAHLVWVRCESMQTALPVTDILVRDANLTLVILDMRLNLRREWSRTPPTFWYQLQRAVEVGDLALVVLTGEPSIPSAQLRFSLTRGYDLAALRNERDTLVAQCAPDLQRQRRCHVAG